jgi:hypothetical protein
MLSQLRLSVQFSLTFEAGLTRGTFCARLRLGVVPESVDAFAFAVVRKIAPVDCEGVWWAMGTRLAGFLVANRTRKRHAVDAGRANGIVAHSDARTRQRHAMTSRTRSTTSTGFRVEYAIFSARVGRHFRHHRLLMNLKENDTCIFTE